MQHVVFISDQTFQQILKAYNKLHTRDFTPVYSRDYTILRDFSRHIYLNADKTLEILFDTLAPHCDSNLYNAYSDLLYIGDNKYSKYFTLFHDSSRKKYLLYWEEYKGKIVAKEKTHYE